MILKLLKTVKNKERNGKKSELVLEDEGDTVREELEELLFDESSKVNTATKRLNWSEQ